MVSFRQLLSDSQSEDSSACGLSPVAAGRLRGWLTLRLLISPAILIAGAVTFLVLH
jgi:hypothetical protein